MFIFTSVLHRGHIWTTGRQEDMTGGTFSFRAFQEWTRWNLKKGICCKSSSFGVLRFNEESLNRCNTYCSVHFCFCGELCDLRPSMWLWPHLLDWIWRCTLTLSFHHWGTSWFTGSPWALSSSAWSTIKRTSGGKGVRKEYKNTYLHRLCPDLTLFPYPRVLRVLWEYGDWGRGGSCWPNTRWHKAWWECSSYYRVNTQTQL